MALHTQLPIYKVAYDLFDTIMVLAKNMPRDLKQSIGGKLRDECIEILTLIFRANTAREKAPHLGDLIERLQVAELLLRLSRDKHLETGQYAKAITHQQRRQAGQWMAPLRIARFVMVKAIMTERLIGSGRAAGSQGHRHAHCRYRRQQPGPVWRSFSADRRQPSAGRRR